MKKHIIFIFGVGASVLFGSCGIYASSFYDTSAPYTYRTLSSQIASESQQKKVTYIVGSAESQNALANQVQELPQLKRISKKYQIMELRPSLNKKNGKWGYVDEKSKFRISAVFDEAKSFKDGIALIKIGNLWGYLRKDGTYLVKPQFISASEFDENGVAIVSARNKLNYGVEKGFVKRDATIIGPMYEDIVSVIGNASNNIRTYFFRDRGLWGIRDAQCNVIKERQYAGFTNSKDIWVSLNGKWGCITNTGKTLISFSLDEKPVFENGMAVVSINGRKKVLKSDGTYFNGEIFDNVKQEKLLVVYDGKLRGIMRYDGSYLYNPQFESIKYDKFEKVFNCGFSTGIGEYVYKFSPSKKRITPNISSYSMKGSQLGITGIDNVNIITSIGEGGDNVVGVTKTGFVTARNCFYNFAFDKKIAPIYSLPNIANKSNFRPNDKLLFYNDKYVNYYDFDNAANSQDGHFDKYSKVYSIKEPVALNLQNTIYTFQHKEGKRVAYNPRNGYFICASKVFLRGDTSKEFLYVMSETGQHIIALEQIYHDFENNNLKLNYLVSLENLKETYHTRLHLREVQVLPNGNIMVATGLASSHDFICIFDKDNFNLIKAAVAIDGAPLGITPTSILFYGIAPERRYVASRTNGFYIYSSQGGQVAKYDNEGNKKWVVDIENSSKCYNMVEINGTVYIAGTSVEGPYAGYNNAILWEIKDGQCRKIALTASKSGTSCLGVLYDGTNLYCNVPIYKD
nr:WG repeat-containing protein [Bacteroides intestinalis]